MPIIPEEAVDHPAIEVPLVDPADEVEDPPIVPPVNPPFVPPSRYFPPQGSVRRALPPASRHSEDSDSLAEHESSDEDRVPRRRARRQAEVPSLPSKCSFELTP